VIDRYVDLFGGANLIVLDVISKTVGAPKKHKRLSSQVPPKLADIDKVSMMKSYIEHKTCCRSPVYRLWD